MARKALFIEYDYCTGCHACEVACKQEHNYSEGRCGVKVEEVVTVGKKENDVNVSFMPYTTRFCDLCATRTARGEAPACVKHCQSRCMAYGDVAEMARLMEKTPKSCIFSPM
jgi:Fe-S-cluster-containing dehydrogenase component